jgi:radical SAM protein with 4Fe4S-binding SPASM domain
MPMHSWGNQHFQESEAKVQYYANRPCVSPFSTMILDVAGRVPLCGCDYNAKIQLGDFSRDTIEHIWRDQPYDRVRSLHASGERNEIELCRGCDVWDRSLVGEKENNDRPAPEQAPNDLQQSLIQIQNDLNRNAGEGP